VSIERAAGIVVLAALLLGCDSSRAASPGPRSPTGKGDTPIANCDEVPCTGVIAGARYEIKLPVRWNGTLLLWSHGYRQSVPIPRNGKFESVPESAPSPEAAKILLAQGYALAGSAYARDGWAVIDGVTAGEQLHSWFVTMIGKPRRTYVWGASLGGLITQTLAEKHPDWVSGAAPVCGVLAGANLTLDLALDVAYAVKTLVYPQLKLARYSSAEEARAYFNAAFKAISAARQDPREGVSKILLIAGLVDAPTTSDDDDGHDLASRLNAIVLALVTAMLYSTEVRRDVEQRAGGNPSTNIVTDYSARVTAAEAAASEALSPGSVNRALALLAQGQRVTADPAARTAADGLGNPTGILHGPTVTLHTIADPLVVVQNESVFRSRVAAAAGAGTAKLLQLYTKPPERYTKATYGAGHCSFTTREWTGVVNLLDMMVRQGTRPPAADITKAFDGDLRLALDYVAPPWPATLD